MYCLTHIIIWFQVNGQFVWSWAKANPWLMSALGLPISYVLIIATKYIVAGFDGLLWPGRLVGFGSGMIVMALLGFPISYILIIATEYIVVGFNGLLWPGRLVGFGSGMIVMAILTWCVLGEGISTKTLVSLALATTLVFIQVLWK